jgi:hypothetical protein
VWPESQRIRTLPVRCKLAEPAPSRKFAAFLQDCANLYLCAISKPPLIGGGIDRHCSPRCEADGHPIGE